MAVHKRKSKYFATQEEGEEVLIVARRHWFVYLVPFVGVSVLFLFSIVMVAAPDLLRIDAFGIPRAVSVSVFSLLALYSLLFGFIVWIVNYLDVQMVTNRHIVDIDQVALFARKISELSLDNIQDVSAHKKGVWENLLNFGDIQVQTAGEMPNFLFQKVANPEVVSKEIMRIKNEYRRGPGTKKGYFEVVKDNKK